MKKYAICHQCIERKFGWLAEPWIKAGAKTFPNVQSIPLDHILISIWPRWRSPVKEWVEKGGNYIEIDYGYWGNDAPRRDTRRVTYNNSHNLKINNPPFSRKHLLNPTIQDWKTSRGNYLLMIEPAPHTYEERTGLKFKDWHIDFLSMLKQNWDGEIKWRRKGGVNGRFDSLVKDIQGSWAIVGENSMACAEAIMLGYPAYTTNDTIVTPLMGKDFSLINDPILPDRTQWLEHVAWSQFTIDEFKQGSKVAELVEVYQINQS